MGSGIDLKCSNCHYLRRFILGIGMLYSPLDIADFDSDPPLLLGLIKSKKKLQEIREILAKPGSSIPFTYGHKIYLCPKCGELYNRFFIQVVHSDGVYEVQYHCTKCKTLIIPLKSKHSLYQDQEIDVTKIHCPNCGKKSLSIGLMLNWD